MKKRKNTLLTYVVLSQDWIVLYDPLHTIAYAELCADFIKHSVRRHERDAFILGFANSAGASPPYTLLVVRALTVAFQSRAATKS